MPGLHTAGAEVRAGSISDIPQLPPVVGIDVEWEPNRFAVVNGCVYHVSSTFYVDGK